MKTSWLALLTLGWALPAHGEPEVQPFALPDAYRERADIAGRCVLGSARSIAGMEPKRAGPFPLFVYLTGTTMNYQGLEAQTLMREMAQRGFVAVSVQYDNGAYAYCSGMTAKARCLFGSANSQSALDKLCQRSNVDCALGVVVAGFSQGANLASLAKNYDARVRAAYLLGHGHKAGNHIEVRACMQDAATVLSASQMRSINAEHDMFFGAEFTRVRKQLEVVTGATCSDEQACSVDGGGFYVVRDAQLNDGQGDHCYFFDAADVYCAKYKGLDRSWATGNEPWTMKYNLDWLVSKVQTNSKVTGANSLASSHDVATGVAAGHSQASSKKR